MSWLFLSLLAALTLATTDAMTKKFFSYLSAYEMGIVRLTYATPWLIVSLFFIPWERPDATYFLCLSLGIPLEAVAFFCYMKALKVSPLSLSLPFLAFTPIFLIFTGWIILGEKVSHTGVVGIIMIVAGSYFLNISHIGKGCLEPIRAIIREPGSRLMLFVSFIYSITASIGKLGILHSNPYFFGVTYFIVLTLFLVAFVPVMPNAKLRHLTEMPLKGMLVGATLSLMVFSHMLALSKIQAAYMISIKRTSLLFGVLYGAWWFKEEKIKERLVGACIMTLGVLVIGFFG